MNIPDRCLLDTAFGLACLGLGAALGSPTARGSAAAGAAGIARWLGPTARSLAGHVNWSEFGRAMVAGAAAGTGFVGYLQAFQASGASLLDEELLGGLAVGAFTVAADLARRVRHQARPAPGPAPGTLRPAPEAASAGAGSGSGRGGPPR